MRAGHAQGARGGRAEVLALVSRALHPVDWMVAGYLVLTTAILLVRPHNVPRIPALLATRVVIGLFLVASTRGWLPRRLAWLRDWYPLLLSPVFYTEVGLLNRAFTQGFFDLHVLDWERAIFHGQPSTSLREQYPQVWVSEYLHLAYFSYYFLAPGLGLYLYLRRRYREFRILIATVAASFFACLALFIAFPVAGPYYILTPPDPQSLGPFLPPIVHGLVRRGSSVGTAFPSSHVAVSMSVLFMAWKSSRVAFLVLLAFVPALAVGAVYGGFHYAIDTLAGLALAAAVCAVVPRWIAPAIQPGPAL